MFVVRSGVQETGDQCLLSVILPAVYMVPERVPWNISREAYHRSLGNPQELFHDEQDVTVCSRCVALEFCARKPRRKVLEPGEGFDEETPRDCYLFAYFSQPFDHLVILVVVFSKLYTIRDLQHRGREGADTMCG